MRRLAAAWPIGIASGALRGEIELMLRGAGLLDRFRFIVASGDTDRRKPAPEPVPARRRAARRARRRVRRDRGLPLGARSRPAPPGMRTIAITHTYPRATLTEADVIIDSLDELTVDFVSSDEARKLEAGSWKPEAELKPEAGSWQLELQLQRADKRN